MIPVTTILSGSGCREVCIVEADSDNPSRESMLHWLRTRQVRLQVLANKRLALECELEACRISEERLRLEADFLEMKLRQQAKEATHV
jgi:hypothetical protein